MSELVNIVDWFEIPVRDMDRARVFYESVFGLELNVVESEPVKMAFFPVAQGAPGAGGSLVKGEGYTPSYQGVVVYMSVDDIEGTLEKVDENGGRALMPKTNIGEYGFIAHFEDTEGNRVALHSWK